MAFNPTIGLGSTPNDGQGAGLRTNMGKLIENDNYLKAQVDAFANSTPGVVSNGSITQLTPLDARFFNNVESVGAIKITLPQSYTSTRITLFISIFDRESSESVELIISGYNYLANSEWLFTTVQVLASLADRNYPVRFGHDGSKCCIYIGELNSSWNPTVVVTKGIFSFNSNSSDKWLTGWNISLETNSFQNVTQIKTNNLIVAQ
ncbi:hypothetical protein [Leptobacterium sp. I13]|uniref:hypothetical protein n=1 Tax=Leptobacterium meishanense TaxID=3128904 RepID=UPI0030EC44BB